MDIIAVKVSSFPLALTSPIVELTPTTPQVYEAMAYHVSQANFNRRVRVVSAWSLQMTASAILSALRSIIDPMASHLREIYAEGFPYAVVFPAGPLPEM